MEASAACESIESSEEHKWACNKLVSLKRCGTDLKIYNNYLLIYRERTSHAAVGVQQRVQLPALRAQLRASRQHVSHAWQGFLPSGHNDTLRI